MSQVLKKRDPDEDLQEACIRFADDPEGFVKYFWDWGEGSLKGWGGPDRWHREVFGAIKEYLEGPETTPLFIAVASGRGAAKTAFVSWVIYWFMSTRPHPQVVCTANTESQLTTRTWRELAKWHKLSANKHWFTWTATSFFLQAHPETWRANAIPWSENNIEAFAGFHEDNMLVVFDEASKISDRIWEVMDGVFTTKKNIWVVCGNGTRNAGRFYECFHDNHDGFWKTWNIDARTCQSANREYLDRLVKKYGGEESDKSKTWVRGLFPSAATHQLISTSAIEKCMKHQAEGWDLMPKVMGVDVARFGENSSAIAIRQGRRVEEIQILPKMDLMQTAHRVAEVIRAQRPLQVFVDGSGIGAGVVDRLRQLNFPVVDVNGGNSSLNPRFLNKRAEMWWEMKEFIEGLCELPPDPDLKKELVCVEYDYTDKGRIRLDRKQDIVEQYDFSPDRADALALTFAYPVSDYSEAGMRLEPVLFDD